MIKIFLNRIYNKIYFIFDKSKSINKTKRHWDNLADENFIKSIDRLSWSGIPQIHTNHNYLITGDPNYYWISYLKDNYFLNGLAGDTLSLGCGEGHVDRILKNCGFQFNSFTGIDISEKAILKAQSHNHDAPLCENTNYYVDNLNNFILKKNSYDFIYFFQSLHHIENISDLLIKCNHVLRKNGILMAHEYTGPSRFQWTESQMNIAEKLLNILPKELRKDLIHGGIKSKIQRPSVHDMIHSDPSEAVKSEDIDPMLHKHFNVIEKKPQGGTLNFLIFLNIAGNFDMSNEYHASLVNFLIHHENALIQNEAIQSMFNFYVCTKKEEQ